MDRYYAQKRIKQKNRDRIISLLFLKPMTFTDLRKEVKLSKPILTKHLKYLKQEGLIDKSIINDRVVYSLTKEAFKLPFLHILIFKNGCMFCIQRELFKEREIYELPPTRFLAEMIIKAKKSEGDIIEAIKKWLSPIILCAIIEELKTGHKWTEIVNGVSQDLMEVIKQKGLKKFEDAVIIEYKEQIDDLDRILELIEIEEKVEKGIL